VRCSNYSRCLPRSSRDGFLSPEPTLETRNLFGLNSELNHELIFTYPFLKISPPDNSVSSTELNEPLTKAKYDASNADSIRSEYPTQTTHSSYNTYTVSVKHQYTDTYVAGIPIFVKCTRSNGCTGILPVVGIRQQSSRIAPCRLAVWTLAPVRVWFSVKTKTRAQTTNE
jgi:hypothetical protein